MIFFIIYIYNISSVQISCCKFKTFDYDLNVTTLQVSTLVLFSRDNEQCFLPTSLTTVRLAFLSQLAI